jgi:hypothetical protein
MVVAILFFKAMALRPSPIAIWNDANMLRESFIVRHSGRGTSRVE